MLAPSELMNTLLFVFCSLFLISDCAIITDPMSTIVCVTEPTHFNASFERKANAGIFSLISNTNQNMPECIRESCLASGGRMEGGHASYLLRNFCYLVKCDVPEYCKPVKADSYTPNQYNPKIASFKAFDAAPIFQALPKTALINENNMPNERIISFSGRAISRTTFERLNPYNATVLFSIVKGNTGNAFTIRQAPFSNNAELLANKRLDRETDSFYYLTIQATNVEEQKTTTKILKVQVADKNDNAPVFQQSVYRHTIYSNITVGSQVYQVRAIDPDTGDNAQIRYSLHNLPAEFEIKPETGIILLKQKLRVDRTKAYTLIVEAKNGVHLTIATVQIVVVPVNEFRPFFQRLNYRVRVSEAVEVGTSIVRISAMDSDTGVLAKLTYTIINGSRATFEVDDNGDVRNIQSLFGMGGRVFNLKIGVHDGGNPPLHATQDAHVTITIVNMKRHKVKFDVPKYTIPVMENIPVSSSILTVRAVSGLSPENLDNLRNKDRKSNINSKRIAYSLTNKDPSSRFFRIGKYNGVLYTSREIDYEKHKEFRLNVVAKDIEAKRRGHRIQRDNATIIIRVLDRNDNVPTFVLSSYQGIVNENATLDSSVLRVTATDADSGKNSRVRYTLVHGNEDDIFSLDSHDGTLRLRKSLSGFHNKFFNLTIKATDNGKPPLSSAPVSIFLKIRRNTDGSPLGPTLSTRHEIVVNETCPVGTVLTTARKLHVLTNRGVGPFEWNTKRSVKYFLAKYFLSGCNEQDYFSVNAVTGELTLRRELDYEKMKTCAFYFSAIDIHTPDSLDKTLVVVKVLDVNDNRPAFHQYKHNVMYSHEPKLFSTVATVEAFDDDSQENGKLTYWMKGNQGGYFKIDPDTGAVKVAKDLQHKTLALFNMKVSVHDHGKPPLISKKDATVNVLVYQPFSTPTILIETTDVTMTMQFNLKYLDLTNVAKFVVIVQEHVPSEEMFPEYTKMKPLTWYLVNFVQKANQNLRRYTSKEVNNSKQITEFGMFQVTIGDQGGCNDKAKARETCSGPLNPGAKYRFQLRVYMKRTGPFQKQYKDGYFSDSFFTGPGKAAKTYRKEGKRNYDAVVYSVGAALVLVIILAFLRGFYRLKLDRLRIHEEKKRRISFPVSNPRFQDPESPVEKIKTPGEGRKLMASIHTEKGSELGRSDEDEGSSPDSALDESTRPLQSSRQKPTLQDIRLKSYFHSVDTESCNSCDGVRVYYMQESTA